MLKKTIALLFVFMLLAPMTARLLWGPWRDAREPAAVEDFPHPYGWALLKNDYYRALDRYINDQVVFKDRLTRIKVWMDLRFFGKTDKTDIHVGRQGWLYRRVDIENHIRDTCGDAGLVKRLRLELQAIEKLTAATGRRFHFLVVPSKASIYPEYIGWVPLPKAGRCSTYDLFYEAQRDLPLASWVPLAPAILAGKFGSHLLYDPTTVYWNGRGAAVAAEVLHHRFFGTNALQQVMAAPERFDDLERQLLGDQPSAPRSVSHRIAGLRTDGIGRSLVYGDAGIDGLLPYLLPMAQEVEVLSTETVPSRQIAEDWRAYDSIILQTTESEFRDLKIDLDRIFDQLSDDAVGQATHTPVDLAAVRVVAHSALNPRAGGLELKSLGARSTFALIGLPGSYRRCFRVLRLNLSALQPDVMTLAYRTHPPFEITRAIQPGRFNLYVPLPVTSTVALRLQPGGQAGLLVLHQAEIIGFPEDDGEACGHPPQSMPLLRAATGKTLPAVAQERGAQERPRDARHGTAAEQPSHSSVSTGMSTGRGVGTETKQAVSTAGLAGTPEEEKPVGEIDIQDRGDVDAESRPADSPRSTPPPRVAQAPWPSQRVSETDDLAPRTAGATGTRVTRPLAARTPSPADKPRIKLNDFADGRIFQRQGRQADIIVSGVYTGSLSAVEARVVRHGRDEVVVPWTLVDDAPRNGIFLGLMPRVPEGGWYELEVRGGNATGLHARGRNRWGVGILIGCLGQSNMKEWFHTGRDLDADPLLRVYKNGGWHTPGRRGNGAIAFGNRIIARTGVPVGLLSFAVNGSGLHPKADWGTGYWADTRSRSIYRRFVNGVAATGGRLEFVIWLQGEADAARRTVTYEEYRAALSRFITRQVRRDIANGSNRPQLPFLVVGMMKRPGGDDAPHQAVREAQLAVAEQVAECYLAATTIDLRNQGKQHLAAAAYTTMGQRVAQTVLFILGLEGFHRGPQVVAVRPDGAQMLVVVLQHRGGSDIRPASGITGWEVVDAQGSVPIQDVIRRDPQTIEIHLTRAMQGTAEVRYLYGARPDARRPLKDNAAPSLPLEAFRGSIDASLASPP
ncbi:MAG: sialate O-acetylesterase [Desulfobacterales bacterium]|nr:sialate O-acetylesterase [Desulfobacterales bacterium]